MVAAGFPPPDATSTEPAGALIALLVVVVVSTALIFWALRTSRMQSESFEREGDQQYDEAA